MNQEMTQETSQAQEVQTEDPKESTQPAEETAAATEPKDAAVGEEAGSAQGAAGEQDTPEDTEDAEAAEDGAQPKKSLFGGKKKEKASKLEEKIAELEDARMRQLAEFENFRKRSEKEKGQMFEIGAKSVVEKILPVLDNFERGLASMPEEEKGTPFADGIQLVYKQMLGAMDEIGVKPIEAVGKEFDPNFHNAVMTVESDELESGMVAEELQKGYLYQDCVVRHSMVKVVS